MLVTDRVCHKTPYFTPVMKRFLQSVALALAAFLAVQPALATMTCAQKLCADGSSSPDCCLPSSGAPMPGMSNDAAMASMSAPGQAPSNPALARPGWVSDPCCSVAARSIPPLAAPVKSRVDGAVAFTRLGALIAASAPDRTAPLFAKTISPARDRPVLFQVFRI